MSKNNMYKAPEYIAKSTCETIQRALVYCRNYTLGTNPSIKQINEIMVAIHAIPEMLYNWNENKLKEIILHLECFDSEKWENAPNLKKYFEEALKRNYEEGT